MLSLLAGLAVLGSLTAHAQDKATLDLLLKKGVITQDEANSLAKSYATPAVVAHDANVKKLQIEGDLQIQYDWLSTSDKAPAPAANPPGVNEFFIRRAHIGAIADFGNGWGGELLMDLAVGAQVPAAPQGGQGDAMNLFEKAIITDKIDPYGMATIGYQKVMFGLEETTSANAVKPIERSLGSRYFDESYKGETTQRIGFANRHVGLYWDGKVAPVPGLIYGAAVTNGIQSSEQYAATGGLNKFGYWTYLGYGSTVADVSFKGGMNVGYSSDANSNPGPGATAQSNSMYGYNPYLTVDYGSFEISSEFEQAMVTNGRTNAGGKSSLASPYAYSFTPSYKITPQWELVFRYSVLNTNGRGTNISDIVRDGPNVTTASTKFDYADQFYAGVNYYILGNSVKFSLGYEYTEFYDRGTTSSNLNGPKADVGGIRARMQIAF